jgi:hypothetical protein
VQFGLVGRLICSGEFEAFPRLVVRFAASYRVQTRASTAPGFFESECRSMDVRLSSRARCSDLVKQQGIIQSDEVKARRAPQCLRWVTRPPEILRREKKRAEK